MLEGIPRIDLIFQFSRRRHRRPAYQTLPRSKHELIIITSATVRIFFLFRYPSHWENESLSLSASLARSLSLSLSRALPRERGVLQGRAFARVLIEHLLVGKPHNT